MRTDLLITALAALLVSAIPATAEAEPRTVVLWHSYRGAEEEALNQVIDRFHAEQDEIRIDSLAVPYDSYASKLTTAIPQDNGPDVFVFAHERIGGWANTGTIATLDEHVSEEELRQFLPETVTPLRYQGHLYGLPLAFKSVALFYNKALVDRPPATTDELIEIARAHSGENRYGLAYLCELFYFHAAWHFGFGAELFDAEGNLALDSEASRAALAFVRNLQDRGLMPQEPTGALIAQLFNEGRAAMVINGPWFTGEIAKGVDFGVAPLPVVSSTGKPAGPFLTDEAVFVSGRARRAADALVVARFLAGADSAQIRARVGRQIVAHAGPWNDPELSSDPVLGAFRTILPNTIPMESGPRMRTVWEPADLMLRKLMRRDADPRAAAAAGIRRHRAVTRALPERASPAVYIILAIGIALFLVVMLGRAVWRLRSHENRGAAARGWTWISPAMTGTVLLLFVPFIVGLTLALFAHHEGEWTFVGLANFLDILSARTYGPTEPLSFYFALAVTALWTAVNLALHVAVGLALAVLLSRPALKLRPLYRVLLIIPWAVPNYITALIWKGMFHKQFGAINGLLEWLGFDSVSWFSSFWTAFFANICANAWLGFPFMMVVCLGALQSIPQDLYEAADVDGASSWQKFRLITLPLLRPALVPAMLIGTVWTFNQFNIVYLVSGGEPDNATDILISEAYRWAFTRQEQYGYAAAYAALIFVILLGWSVFAARAGRRVEESL